MKKFYFFLFVYFCLYTVQAATIISAATGDWSNGTSWVGGIAPTQDDDVVIAAGTTITNAANVTCKTITINGTLTTGKLITVNGDFVIGVGGVYNPNGQSCQVFGNFTNDGTANFDKVSVFYMYEPTPAAATTIGGSGTYTVVRNLRILNPSGVTLAVPLSVCASLDLLKGTFHNGSNLTLDNTNAGTGSKPATVILNRYHSGELESPYTLGANAKLALAYLKNTAYKPVAPDVSISSGYEIPAGGTITSLTVNNPEGVELWDNLTLTSATPLTLTTGIVTSQFGATITCTDPSYNGTAGLATSYIIGGVALTAGTTPSDKTYPIGSSAESRPVTLNGLAASSGTVTVKFEEVAPDGGTSAANVTLSTSRRWAGTVTDGTLGQYTGMGITYGDDDNLTAPSGITVASALSGYYSSLGIGVNTESIINAPVATYTTLGYYALGSGAGILPVTLINFETKLNNGAVQLNWSSASETDNGHFEVERSLDGVNFLTIATVQGAGNSAIASSYTVYDRNPVAGTDYYRLKQVDKNGTVSYYGVQSVKVGTLASNGLSVYVGQSDEINIRLFDNSAKQLNVSIVDLSGRIIQRETVYNTDGDGLFQVMPKQVFLPGIYTVHVTGENIAAFRKVVIAN